ncbi:MAG: family 78 glycoside hydrolase catalytic domain [Phycisphaerales bacterium]|nr:family 78 glycoside hydrolase catalytic domain [Phycisphaerales bacterium]
MPRAPFLRSVFATTPGRAVKRATLYATALGLYECRLNGAKVGDDEMTPGWTEYSKRVEHRTYDVTPMVRGGGAENCLGAVLGDGWYAGLMGYTGQRRFYHGPARFMGQLEVEYDDGSWQVIATGPGWRASFGPILHTDNYIGSEVDTRLAMDGWDTPVFDASGWLGAEVGLARSGSARQADVTERVRAAVRDGRVSLKVGPDALGDPAYGVVKRLHVEYSTGGTAREVVVPENERLELPRAGEWGGLVITRAVFAEPVQADGAVFVVEPAMGEPVKRFEELPTVNVTEPRRGRYVFDLGQNMVGWARLHVSGRAGQRLVVRHAEMLNPDGTLYTSNLRGAIATDVYTLRGGPEVLEPPFTFHGFRYVEVTGLGGTPPAGMVTGVVAHTAMRPAGAFECSSPLLNRLAENIRWGQKGNYFEVPTDCPQRDERLGWTGDAQFFIPAAVFNFGVASFMERWLKTLDQDAQLEDGSLAHVAPRVNERGGSTAWGDAGIVCTHAVYRTYGDTRVIRDNYDAMVRYLAWLDSKTSDGVAHVGGFGDWLNLGDPTPSDLIDTAYRAELYRLMSEMAAAVGRRADADRFAASRAAAVAAFRRVFVGPRGDLKGSGQTGYALAFTMGLIPEDLRSRSADRFVEAVERKGWRLATGFIGTPRLLPALAYAGRDGVAGRLLLNDDYPSWLYQVKLGATTMWERWDGWTPERGFANVGMNSFNHYAFGSVGAYLFGHVAGITETEPGYAGIRIAPILVDGLDHAGAWYDSAAGEIVSRWRRVEGGVEYTVRVPANTRAEVCLPLGRAGVVVTEGDRAVARAPGVEGVEVDASARVVRARVSPGSYVFTVR